MSCCKLALSEKAAHYSTTHFLFHSQSISISPLNLAPQSWDTCKSDACLGVGISDGSLDGFGSFEVASVRRVLGKVWTSRDHGIVIFAQLVKPWVTESVLQRDSLLGILYQQLIDKVDTLLGVVLPLGGVKYDSLFACHSYGFLLRVVIEWQRTAQKCVDDAAKTPKVTLERVGFLQENLWCHISQRPKRLFGLLVWPNHLSQAEVYQFWH